MTEVGTAYVTVIPKTDDFSSGIAEASREAGAEGGKGISDGVMGSLQSTVGDLFGTGGEMGSSLTGGMESFIGGAGKLAIGAAVAAIGIEALNQLEQIGEEIDAMTDTIIIGTGASGEQLQEMREIAMSVTGDVAVSMGDAGDIIQDFSTRLGLSGDDLESVTLHAAQLNEVLGGFNYDNMATMFNVWGVGADDMNAKMDYMWGVAQNTGISFDSLTSIMKTSGPTLQALGFSFEESANMAGLLDKSGIDASSTMGKLSKALMELSEPGESAQDAFRRSVDEMQQYIDAGDKATALNLAEELFGTRGAAQFIAALESGALNMDELADSALGATGNIEETYQATESWPELWMRIQSTISSALEPFASGMFDAIKDILEGVSEAMTLLWEASEPVRDVIGKIADGIGQRLQPLAEKLSPVMSGLADTLGGTVAGAFQAVAGVVGGLADAISWLWDNVLAPFGQWLEGTFGPIFDAVGEFMTDPIGAAVDFLSGIPEQIIGFFSGLGESITTAIGSIHFPLPHITFEEELDIAGVLKIPLPSVKWYASGGFVDGATLIGAGEAGPEMVLPQSGSFMDRFAEAVSNRMGGTGGIYVTVNAHTDADANEIALLTARKVKQVMMARGA